MLSKADVDALANEIFTQHERRQTFAPIPGRLPTLEDAQAVQDAYVALLKRKHGTDVGGYKIALSSKQTRDWLKVYEPCCGQILANRIHHSPYTVQVSEFVRFSLEPEVCVILDKDISGPCTIQDVQRAMRSIHCAYELVEDRDADLTKIDACSLTADNSWNAGIVIGPPAPRDIDLNDLRGRLTVNGKLTQQGTTAETMDGNPLDAVVWIAGYLGRRGQVIKAGQPVITGSIIRSQFLVKGDVASFAMDGMPAVEVRLV
jgi:2-keto-4-pentenoate hydratase